MKQAVNNSKCPECGSPLKTVSRPLSVICVNNDCQFQAEPGEFCNHLDSSGDPDVILAGESHEHCWWECNKCGEPVDEEIYGLDNPSHEWLDRSADEADQLREWYA